MLTTQTETTDSYKAPTPNVFRTRGGRFFRVATYGFSQLAVQLIAVSLIGLTLTLAATLQVANLRSGAADAVTQSLLVQSDALLAALAAAKSNAGDEQTGLLWLVTEVGGETAVQSRPRPPGTTYTEFDRARLEGLLQAVLEGSQTRVRIYGADGERIVDTSITLADTAPAQTDEAGDQPAGLGLAASIWETLAGVLLTPEMPSEPPTQAPAADYREVAASLGGVKAAQRRVDSSGNIIVSVASPVYANGLVVASVNLRSVAGAVTRVARAQEIAIVRVFLLAAGIAILVCLLLAATITRPIRRLAAAADRIRRGGVSTPMPELRDGNEVGELSRILHDMTVALYARIDSIEAFAGEVAHELKNPLTSLRSAAETMPLARTENSRNQLLEVIQHDVRRIDRLITDISDASKLDAELNRYRYERFDLIDILSMVVSTQGEIASDRSQSVELVVRGADNPGAFQIIGNDSRLSQVFTNLIDNARAFTPDGGRVVTTAERFSTFIEVVVDDEGPGIEEEMLERVFERFYTDRSGQSSFGNSSGLGLAISRQIIEAHNGEIFAENRYRTTLGPDRDVAGARLTVRLPTVS
ncbi:MAG: stimulus-sensing domain-containing protein [Pseudomonadota bacterium]